MYIDHGTPNLWFGGWGVGGGVLLGERSELNWTSGASTLDLTCFVLVRQNPRKSLIYKGF